MKARTFLLLQVIFFIFVLDSRLVYGWTCRVLGKTKGWFNKHFHYTWALIRDWFHLNQRKPPCHHPHSNRDSELSWLVPGSIPVEWESLNANPYAFTLWDPFPLQCLSLLPLYCLPWEFSGSMVWCLETECEVWREKSFFVFHESDLGSHFQTSAGLMCTHCPFQFHCPASYLRVYQHLFQCWILYAWLEQAQTHRFVDCWINSWSKVIPTKYLCELESWSFLARKTIFGLDNEK